MSNARTALGIISGTSIDGIDVARVTTDGVRVFSRGPGATFDYPDAVRKDLVALLSDPYRAEHGPVADLERAVTAAHVAAVQKYLATHGFSVGEFGVAGFHGQTVLHRPDRQFTRQLFDGALAARLLGIDVVTSFRIADVQAGGQGAPLVPLYHQALVREAGLDEPVMVLNLGGVGNVTYIDGETVIAFDTGPASALIDDWVRQHDAGAFDENGRLAAQGCANEDIVDLLMADPYFSKSAPKSLDRNHFHTIARAVEGMSLADGTATLSAFTVRATVCALRQVPKVPKRWIVAGGGRLNLTIMSGLATILGVPVDRVELVGWDGDQIEAECFAFLAVRSLTGLPLSLPSTTGVPRPMPGGVLFGLMLAVVDKAALAL